MCKYLLLMNPGQNRVYFDSTKNISINELKAVLFKKNKKDEKIKTETIKIESVAGVEYISFESEEELNECDFIDLSRLSSFFAVFLQCGENLLKPITCNEWRSFPDNLNNILKYNGKTNEQLTRLMMNLAVSFCKTKTDKRLHLLDPMCGKGTTLFEGAIQGLDTTGIEIMSKYAEESHNYFIKYLENGKYKHKASRETRSDSKGKKIAGLFQVEFAKNKTEFSDGNIQKMRFFSGDSIYMNQFIKKQSIDVVVTDLPYGVQHGSILTNKKNMSKAPKNYISRSAIELIENILPMINIAMKDGGSIVMSFNEFTTKKDQLIKLLTQNGFTVVNNEDEGFTSFLHRVDQSIKRDIIIAVKC